MAKTVKNEETKTKKTKVRIKSLLDANIVYSKEIVIPPFSTILLEEKVAKDLIDTKYCIVDKAIGE